MIDIESKIKKAFELSDLLYSRERDRISSELEIDLPKISNSFESRGIFYSGMHVDKIFNRKLEAIEQFVNFRITLDMQEANKIVDLITVKIYEIIFERVLQLIEGQIENLKLEMEKFCKHFPNLYPYLDLIDTRLKDEKNKLISYAKREVDIFQKQSESNVQRDKNKEKKFIISKIIEKVDSINSLMEQNYKIKLFVIQEQKIWNNLFEP